jgi:hypothetical protein
LKLNRLLLLASKLPTSIFNLQSQNFYHKIKDFVLTTFASSLGRKARET